MYIKPTSHLWKRYSTMWYFHLAILTGSVLAAIQTDVIYEFPVVQHCPTRPKARHGEHGSAAYTLFKTDLEDAAEKAKCDRKKGVKVHTCTVVVKESSPSVEFSYHASVDHVEDDKQVIYKWRFIEAHSMLVSVLHSRHS